MTNNQFHIIQDKKKRVEVGWQTREKAKSKVKKKNIISEGIAS